MTTSLWHRLRLWACAFAVLVIAAPVVAQQPITTFTVTIKLPKQTLRVGEELVIAETITNGTDHIVIAGNGPGVGSTVEAINEQGEDVGRYAMGGAVNAKDEEPTVVTTSNKLALRPDSDHRVMWHYEPTVGLVPPGTYKIRTHLRDMISKKDVYSNVVVLTIVP